MGLVPGLVPGLKEFVDNIKSSGQDPVTAAILARYGYLGAFLNHPEVGPLLRTAATNGWSKEILQGALANTTWYKTTSAQARQWALLNSSDTAEANRLRNEKRFEILQMFTEAGIEAPLSRINEMAEAALAQGLDAASLKYQVAAEAQYNPNAQVAGSLLQTQQKVKALAYDQLLPMSDETAFDWAKKITSGAVTEDAVTSSLRAQAISRFPQFADSLNNGVSVKQIAAPYAEQTAQLLEISPETINMLDPKYARMLDSRDDKGNVASMSLSDAATYVRSMNEWQYTQGAHEEAATMAESITKTFGKVA